MDLLDNVVQPYAWGSHTAIARLLGRPTPSTTPEAELWMGAHPGAPSRLQGAGGGTLLEAIRAAPDATLGPAVAGTYGPTLPFLLKVLAAQTPLSLQAHPSLAQAKEGFERENAAGVPPGAPSRNYKDANHKPELLCALEPFEALCGFRQIDQTLALFDLLPVGVLDPVLAPLRKERDSSGLRRTFEALMTLSREEAREAVTEVTRAARPLAEVDGPFRASFQWALRLEELYPGDVGVIGSLLLNVLHLEPGEAVFLPAGNLHAYLKGVGIEIMANSDNVLRGGCTPKHVDVPELLRVLDFTAGPIQPLRPRATPGDEEIYDTPAREFRLSRIRLAEGARFHATLDGPEILLCVEGTAVARTESRTLQLRQGTSVFVAFSDREVEMSGTGTVFRATVGDGSPPHPRATK